MAPVLNTNITWRGGVQMQDGGRGYVSRYGTPPTPNGVWSTTPGSGQGQANIAYEAAFTITASGSLVISLVGANTEKDVDNNLLALAVVKGVEVVITTPFAAGVSLVIGPQNQSNAAQLWYGGVTALFSDIVRDRFANLDRGSGWTLTPPATNFKISNPSAVSVSGWIRIIGA